MVRDAELPIWRIAPFDTGDAVADGDAAADGEQPPVVAAPAYRGELAAAIDDARERQAAGGSDRAGGGRRRHGGPGRGAAGRGGHRRGRRRRRADRAAADRRGHRRPAAGWRTGSCCADSGLAILTEADLTGTRGVNPEAAGSPAADPPAQRGRPGVAQAGRLRRACPARHRQVRRHGAADLRRRHPRVPGGRVRARASVASRATGCSCRPMRSTCCPGTSAVRCRR